MARKHLEGLKRLLAYLTLVVASFLSLFPVVWIFLTSLKRPLDTFAIPPVFVFRPTLESYRMLAGGIHSYAMNPLLYAKNSIITAMFSTLLSILAGTFAAYSLSRFRFRGRNAIGLGILATRMLPPIATAIPLFLLMHRYQLLDTRIGLSLAYTVINLPFTIWMLRGFIDEIPVDLEEAAMIDGCTRMKVLLWVIAPLIAPGLAATSIFAFLLSWNDFALALILSIRNAKTLPLIVMSFVTDEGIMWGPMSAMATLTLLPPIIFVMLAQKYLARGLTMGAVKG